MPHDTPRDIQDALEAVSVHSADELIADTSPDAQSIVGWWGVSTDTSGGVIAYFATYEQALAYRLLLVNALCNPKMLRI